MSSALAIDLILGVRRSGTALSYELCSPARTAGFYRRTIDGPELHAPDTFRDDLFRKLDGLHRGIDTDGRKLLPTEVSRDLESLGHELYHHLFPQPLRELYRAFRTRVKTLLVVSDEPWIPWELVKPYGDQLDDDFLCLQLRMSRWLPRAGPLVIARGIARLLAIEVGQPEGQSALTSAKDEIERLRQMGQGLFDLTTETDASFESVELLLQRGGWDAIHFAGHGDWAEASDDSSVELSDRPFRVRHLSGAVEARLLRDRPVVFFNACRVARMGRALSGLGGWAERWVDRCGASVFLAPFWSVSDEGSCAFAEVVYRELRAGQPLGEAVRTARLELRAAREGDITWLAYSLYGHPLAQVRMGEHVIEEVEHGAGGWITTVADEPVLSIPQPPWRSDRSPPGALLKAEHGIVPFHFREQEIRDLEIWCHDEAPVAVRLYTGVGGMGKTRLALEICKRMRSAGWQAGRVDTRRTPEEVWHRLERDGRPRLILIDYAETHRDLLVALLRAAYRADHGPIRLVLLARAALDWWDRLKTEGEGVGDLLRSPASSWRRLPALALDRDAREQSYRRAAQAFSERLEKTMPEQPPADFDAKHYERALVLHMSALAQVEGAQAKSEDEIFDYVLDRERRFWHSFAQERELERSLADGIGRAMALITLGGGADSEDRAVTAMQRLQCFKDDKYRDLVAVARLLRDVYPGEHRWIDPVMPDPLGEHLIRREMEKNPDELLEILMKAPAPAG